MSGAARSILVFGVYLIATSLVLISIPNTLLGLLSLPPTSEPWIRVLGAVGGVLGFYYVAAARGEMAGFFHATVWGRLIALIAFALLVVLRLAPPILLVFGLVDAAGALWTRTALRSRRGAG